jgi:hypothetical protein
MPALDADRPSGIEQRPRFGGAFSLGRLHLGADQYTPPVIGRGAPVVVGNESGQLRRARSAR